MHFDPLPDNFGARIIDFAIEEIKANPVSLREALNEYGLLVTSIPDFDEDDQRAFAQIFGEITIRGNYDVDPETPDMQYVSNARKDGILATDPLGFHHDHLFYENPLTALVLYGIEIPASGSLTRFRSTAAMYDVLSDDMRKRLETIDVLHMYDYGKIHAGNYVRWDEPENATPGTPYDYKPYIWKHPVTGRFAVLHSPSAAGFKGISKEDGIQLYSELSRFFKDHVDDIAHYNHHWQVGDLLIWDNMMVAHARDPYNTTEKRTLRRSPII